MRQELVAANVVVVTQNFNPSIVDQLWLVRHNLVAENDFQKQSIFADTLVQVVTPHFLLLLTPERIQFVPKVPEEEREELVVNTFGAFTRHLSYAPFRAIGLNFTWHLIPDDVRALTRSLCFVPESPLFSNFDTPDANFGAYLSKDIFAARLNLEVKPVTFFLPEGKTEERAQFYFNYHRDLPAGAVALDVIAELLRHWNVGFQGAYRIVESISNENGK